MTVGGERHRLPDPFFVLATQNPIEQEGTYPLPEAQLDRFMLNILVDYPDGGGGARHRPDDDLGPAGRACRKVLSGADILGSRRWSARCRWPTTSRSTRSG